MDQCTSCDGTGALRLGVASRGYALMMNCPNCSPVLGTDDQTRQTPPPAPKLRLLPGAGRRCSFCSSADYVLMADGWCIACDAEVPGPALLASVL